MTLPALPVLYSFRRCPYAMRARLALKVAGVSVALREIVLRDKPAEMLAISPKGTVPVLQCADGRVIDESLDIMRWALAQRDPQRWLGQRGPGVHAPDFVAINDGVFKAWLDQYKYPERCPAQPGPTARDAAVAALLLPMEARLQASACLLGDAPTLVDMAVMPFVRQFAAVDAAWFHAAPLPAVRQWLARLTGSSLFASAMQKLPPWVPGQAVVLL